MITWIFLSFLISPFLYLYLKKRKLAAINAITAVSYFASWFSVWNYNGTSFQLNSLTVIWITLLLISLAFLLIGAALIFYRILPAVNRYIIPTVIIFALAAGMIIALFFYDSLEPSSFLDITLKYITPIYIAGFLMIGTIQLDKEYLKKETLHEK